MQHLQSIQVTKVAKKEDAHGIAKRIHSLILQNFTSETVVRLDADADEHMAAEEGEEEVEDNSTEDGKTCDDGDGPLFISQSVRTNATSVESSMGPSSVRFILLDRRETIWLSTFGRVMKSNLQTGTCYRPKELNLTI